MATTKIQFNAGALEQKINDRSIGKPAATVMRDLGRYYGLMEQCLPAFTHGEACVLVDAISAAGKRDLDTGGFNLEPSLLWAYVANKQEKYEQNAVDAESFRQHMGSHLTEAGVLRMHEQLILGKGVDVDDLVERLRKAPACQLLAILDAVERVVWEYPGTENDPVLTAFTETELTRVGLMRERI